MHYIPEMTLTDYICQKKKEEDLPALAHQYNDREKRGKRLITATRNNTDNTRTIRTTPQRLRN